MYLYTYTLITNIVFDWFRLRSAILRWDHGASVNGDLHVGADPSGLLPRRTGNSTVTFYTKIYPRVHRQNRRSQRGGLEHEPRGRDGGPGGQGCQGNNNNKKKNIYKAP